MILPLLPDLPRNWTDFCLYDEVCGPVGIEQGETEVTRQDLKRVDSEPIKEALEQAGGKVSGAGGAAELLNMKPTTLASRIKAVAIIGERGRTRRG